MEMERRLLEEMAGMKGGQGRLEKILDEYKRQRAAGLVRVQEIDELTALIVSSLQGMKSQKVDAAAE